MELGAAADALCRSIREQRAPLFDAIVVLGGGVPLGPREQLPFVANRCDAAAAVRAAHPEGKHPVILCLSAGTACTAQLLSASGLPVYESTASAARLLDHWQVPAEAVFVETASYDTIGNAFFARTTHTDIAGWRNLLVVTSEFHMTRTKAIFDWIFRLDAASCGTPYRLDYLATPDVSLDSAAIAARAEHEKRSAENVRSNLAPANPSLRHVHVFLTSKHDCYTAARLVERASAPPPELDSAFLKSYGARQQSASLKGNKGQVASAGTTAAAAAAGFAVGLLVAWCLSHRSRI